MSVDTHIHCGPYILAKDKEKLEKYTIHTCLNESCRMVNKKMVDGLKFCSECGSQLIDKELTAKISDQAINALDDDYIDKFFNATSCGRPLKKGYNILCPNQEIEGISRKDIDLHEANVYELDKFFDIEEEIMLMQNQYHREIEFLLNNKFELTFHWGIIVYFS